MSSKRTSRAGVAAIWLASALVALSACGKDETNNPPAQSIGVSAAPTSVTVAQGATTTTTITVARNNGFTGAVNLTLEGAPAGLTATFAPASVASGTTSTLTLAAGASLAPGTYPTTVRAKGTNVADATVALSVVVTQAPTPTFTLALSPTSLNLAQGGSGSVTATISRGGGFTGPVNLAVTGAPAGVTTTITTTPVTGNTATIGVAVGASTAPGTYTLTVTGSGTGVSNKTATITLTVTAAQTGSFTLALAPTALSVAQGASQTSTATVTRAGGFTGAVDLAISGAPAGLTVTANPSTIPGTGTTSTITAAASASLAPGTYNVTVTGTGTGVANQTATLAVTVTATSSQNITLAFCAEDAPIWVAVQNGTGAWTRVTGTNNTYTFTLPAGRGGVAYVTGATGGSTDLTVLYATAAELAGTGGTFNVACTPTGGKTVNGSVAGLGATDFASIRLGTATASVIGSGPSTFQLTNVPEGAIDLIASRSALSGSTLQLNSLIIRRGLNPANNSTLPVLDFGSAEAFAPASATVTINGLGTDQASVGSALVTASGATTFFSFGAPSTSTTQTFFGVPDARLVASDLHELFVSTSTTGSSRAAIQFNHSLANRTVTLGPALGTPTVSTVATTPYLRLRATLAKQTEYNRSAMAIFSQSSGTVSRTATVSVTAGYEASGTFTLEIPDFTGVAGWDNSWGLQAGVATNWTVQAIGGTFFFGLARPSEGATVTFASRNGTI